MKLPLVTLHGRFQPPLHANHWQYVANALELADKVRILITNPNLAERTVAEATHRNQVENNPFTYEERVRMFESFFERSHIPRARFEFRPFDITDPAEWAAALDKDVPNVVNTYSPWSLKKLAMFQENGYPVIHTQMAGDTTVSGTRLRQIVFSGGDPASKAEELTAAGLMPAALPGLLEVLRRRVS